MPLDFAKVGWTDEARAAALETRRRNKNPDANEPPKPKHSNMHGGVGPDPHGPHRVTIRLYEIEHGGDIEEAMDSMKEAIQAAGATHISARQLDEQEEYEAGEVTLVVRDYQKFRDALAQAQKAGTLQRVSGISEVQPTKKDGSLLPGREHDEAVARMTRAGYKVTQDGDLEDAANARRGHLTHTTTLRHQSGKVGRVQTQPGGQSIDDDYGKRRKSGLDPFMSKRWTDEARAAALLARQRNAAQNDAHYGLVSHGWENVGGDAGAMVYQNPFYPKQQIGVSAQGAWTHQDWRDGGKTVARGPAARELRSHLETWRYA